MIAAATNKFENDLKPNKNKLHTTGHNRFLVGIVTDFWAVVVLIIPVCCFANLPMKQAVGTSLLIIL
jgi:uncharacterized membrane protein YfcA